MGSSGVTLSGKWVSFVVGSDLPNLSFCQHFFFCLYEGRVLKATPEYRTREYWTFGGELPQTPCEGSQP